jgi:hypothetical protein
VSGNSLANGRPDTDSLYAVGSSPPAISSQNAANRNRVGVVEFVKPQIGGRRLEDDLAGSTSMRPIEAGDEYTQFSEVTTINNDDEVITENIQGEYTRGTHGNAQTN